MKARIFSDVKVLALLSAVVIASFLFVFLQGGEAENSVYEGPPKAVIIDQLYDDIPNDIFHQYATEYLESAGYQVDIITTKQITVDFYKQLPEMNYKFVVARTHGVADATNEDAVLLFTGEKYKTDSYVQEQLFGQIKKGIPLYSVNYSPSEHKPSDWNIVNDTYVTLTTPVNIEETISDEYFLITPKLVDELMTGKFSETIFILGGCSTLANPSLADSLIARGASQVVGWDDTVSSSSNDRLMLKVLELALVNNLNIEDAVNLSMEKYFQQHGPYTGKLKYYSGSEL